MSDNESKHCTTGGTQPLVGIIWVIGWWVHHWLCETDLVEGAAGNAALALLSRRGAERFLNHRFPLIQQISQILKKAPQGRNNNSRRLSPLLGLKRVPHGVCFSPFRISLEIIP